MYLDVEYKDIRVYESLGLVSILGELLWPTEPFLSQEDLSSFKYDTFWLRTLMGETGELSYTLMATFFDGSPYTTMTIHDGYLCRRMWDLCIIQRAIRVRVRRRWLSRNAAAIAALKSRLTTDLIKLCLP